MNTPVYAYDYFAGTGQLVNPWDTIQKQITGDALYMVLAPVGPSGIAILGNANQFVTMGKKRVAGLADYGAARVAVNFATGESSVVITGYSLFAPTVQAIQGSIGPVTYDDTTHLFRVPVMPGSGKTATIACRRRGRTGCEARTGTGTSAGRSGVE